MAECHYAEWLSGILLIISMLNVTYNPFMQSVIMLSVILMNDECRGALYLHCY